MKGICIGMGNRGKSWYQWAVEAGVEVAGVVDLNKALLDQKCDELEVPESMRFTSIREAARATDAVMATICSANPAHAVCLHECLDAGLHAIVEKPMVESAEDALAIIEKAESRGLHVAVSQNYRYTPGVLTARNAIENGEIGEVLKIHINFTRWRPTEGLFLPLMLNQSIHHFDSIRFVLGKDPEWCFARSWNPSWNECDGPTVLEAVWGFGEETVASYSGSYVAMGRVTPYSGLWTVEGSKGKLEFSGDGKNPTVTLTRREPEEDRELDLIDCGMSEPAKVCRLFLESLEAGRPAPTDARDNIGSLAMAWAAQLSSDEGRVVQIPEIIGTTV